MKKYIFFLLMAMSAYARAESVNHGLSVYGPEEDWICIRGVNYGSSGYYSLPEWIDNWYTKNGYNDELKWFDDFYFHVQANCSLESREGYIILREGDSDKHYYLIRQLAHSPSVDFEDKQCEVSGGEYLSRVCVPGYVEWTTSSSEDWITVSPLTATGTNDVVISVRPNITSGEVRSGKIEIAGNSYTISQVARDNNMSIIPSVLEFNPGGGYGAISTMGSSKVWAAAVSDSWIVLKSTSGMVGKGCVYTVTANTNVEMRTGYVYVNGYVHTVKQTGWGATISPDKTEVEFAGETGTVEITVSGEYEWNARSNEDWLSVTPMHGVGSGSVTYQVAPWHEMSTRSGTLTIAGNTFTVFQNGKGMNLSSYEEECNCETHILPITVDALAITKWNVTANADWLSVVDAGSGQGDGDVRIAVAENPSYKPRTGTVMIGTETITVVQAGQTALTFAIDPETTAADECGAIGHVEVTATPDLPWKGASVENWLTINPEFATGAGNGKVIYTVSPNPTLYERTGTITITPEATNGVTAKTHTVMQPAALSSVSLTGYEFAAAGENCAIEVLVEDIVEWEVEGAPDWLSLEGDMNRVGPATITLQAAENKTLYSRSCTLTIAGKAFKVTQLGLGITVDKDSFVFGTESQSSSFTVSPEGNVSWTPVSSDDSWLILIDDSSRTGCGEVQFVLTQNNSIYARTGTITIGDKVIYVTQRAFDLSIDPVGAWVTGDAGSGSFGVSATAGARWNAIVTVPWIEINLRYASKVWYTYKDNNTGKTRTGKIIVSGTVYTIEQAARVMVSVKAESGHGGKVSGGGLYSQGSEVTLTAIPSDGYQFAHWEGDVSSVHNPITVKADGVKRVKAIFTPLTPEFTNVVCSTDGVVLNWRDLAWATEYRIYRASSSVKDSVPFATLKGDRTCTYADTTGEPGQVFWYWIEAIGDVATNECREAVCGSKHWKITYENLRGTTHANPMSYAVGTSMVFSAPSALSGYSFAGWTPASITMATNGDLTVRAGWTANRYEVIYDANGGLGEMANGEFVYDVEEMLAENSFTREGYRFAGWSDLKDKNCADWLPSSVVSNLTATADGRVTLYAVWSPNSYSVGFNPNGGSGVMADQAYTYGEAQALTRCAFTRKGYAFAGWRIGGEDVAETLLDGAVVSNLTASANGRVELYADWKIVESESAPALPEHLKGDGLIAHYEFNGDARDSSGNGNNGVLHGPVLSVDRFGDSDQAYCFDGDDDWIEVAHSESLSLITNEITVSLWIKPTKWWDKAGSSPAIPFVCKSNKSYAEGSFRVFAEKHNGDAVFRGVENATYSSDDRLVLDEWQHIVIVYAGATRVYRNGALLASAATACEVHRYQDVMAIGRDIVGGVTQFFAGEMDDLRIYNFGLTDDEVNMLYAVENVREVDSLPDLENPTRAEIEAVLTGAKDVGLAANITNAAEYADFRTWACAVKSHDGDKAAGVDVVMAAPTAWLSYALGSETLIESVPTNGQMRVEKFEPAPNAGWFDFTVSIGDIDVASNATKENLKKVFSLEGGETLDALSSTNIDISFGTPENGKVKFTAGPNARNADAKTFFMKVKMTP